MVERSSVFFFWRSGMLAAMWRWAVLLGLAQVVAAGQQKVPFVGCPGDGQLGPQKAPKGQSLRLNIDPALARQVAYYSGGRLAAIGPRGWSCLFLYGSGGGLLLVTPEPINRKRWFSASRDRFTGPVIEIADHDSVASGRYQVAEIIARLFPSRLNWAEEIYDIGKLPTGPYASDELLRLADNTVEFTTPVNEEGLGTHSWIEKSEIPIHGAAYLNAAPNAFVLSVRLPKGLDGLVPMILKQFEKDVVKLD